MPTLSCYFIRSALGCLAIGFTLGGLILSAKAGFVDLRVWLWLPVHIALLVNGWLLQLTLGVAYWILPRIHLSERGRMHWAWSSFVLFQIGLLLVLVSGLSFSLPKAGVFFAPGVIVQAIGVLFFAIHAAPRIRPAIVRGS
jgi:hypothetical protein